MLSLYICATLQCFQHTDSPAETDCDDLMQQTQCSPPPGPAEWGQCVRSSEYARPPRAQQQRWVQSQTNHSLRLSLALCLKKPNKLHDSFCGTDTVCRYCSSVEHWKYEENVETGGKSTTLRDPVYWGCYKDKICMSAIKIYMSAGSKVK